MTKSSNKLLKYNVRWYGGNPYRKLADVSFNTTHDGEAIKMAREIAKEVGFSADKPFELYQQSRFVHEGI